MKPIFPHIPLETLVGLAETRGIDKGQRQDDGDESSIHLSKCAECATQLERVSEVITLMRSDREPDAPRDVLAFALNIFDRPAKGTAASIVRRLIAALTFDSATDLVPAFGVRSSQSGARQLLYSAEGHDIEIRLRMEENEWNVAGQILSEGCEGAQVSLEKIAVQDSDVPTTRALNESGEFNFSSVPSGHYKLLLRLSDVELEVPQFELKA